MENQEPSLKMPQGYSLAMVSFILGLIGLLTLVFCVGIVFGIASLILGYLSLRQYRQSGNKTGRNFALAGIILGIICIILFGLLTAGFFYLRFLHSPNDSIISKFSRVRNDHRSIAIALEAYYVENNYYPQPDFDEEGRPVTPRILTTPLAYLNSLAKDPFKNQGKGLYEYGGGDLKGADPHTGWFKDGWIVTSYGPDNTPGNALYPDGKEIDPFQAWSDKLLGHKLESSSLTYDPTNGLKSAGDIWRRGP